MDAYVNTETTLPFTSAGDFMVARKLKLVNVAM